MVSLAKIDLDENASSGFRTSDFSRIKSEKQTSSQNSATENTHLPIPASQWKDFQPSLLLLASLAILLMQESFGFGDRGNEIVRFDCQNTASACVKDLLGGVAKQHSLDATAAHGSDDNQVGSLVL